METQAPIHPITQSNRKFGTLQPVKGMEFPRYYLRVIKSISVKQQIDLHRAVRWENVPFRVSNTLLRRWERLYGLKEQQSPACFTYHVKIGRDFLFDALSALGANFLNLMYLGVNITYHQDRFVYDAGRKYFFSAEISNISRLNHNRAIIEVKGELRDEDNCLLLTQCDKFFLSRLSDKDIAKFSQSPWPEVANCADYKGLSKRSSDLNTCEGVNRQSFQLANDTGFQYGLISGDLNPIHTQTLFSKMAGHKKSFVQGLYTANYMLNRLVNGDGRAIKNLDIKFCNPIYTASPIEVLYQNGKFEFLDEQQKVLAFGTWRED